MPRMVDNLPGLKASSELAAVRNQTSVTSRFGLSSSNLSPKDFVTVRLQTRAIIFFKTQAVNYWDEDCQPSSIRAVKFFKIQTVKVSKKSAKFKIIQHLSTFKLVKNWWTVCVHHHHHRVCSPKRSRAVHHQTSTVHSPWAWNCHTSNSVHTLDCFIIVQQCVHLSAFDCIHLGHCLYRSVACTIIIKLKRLAKLRPPWRLSQELGTVHLGQQWMRPKRIFVERI